MLEALMLWDLLIFNTMAAKLYDAILLARFPIVGTLRGSIPCWEDGLVRHFRSADNAEAVFNVPGLHSISFVGLLVR